DEASAKRIAAAIVLGEIRAKGASVTDGLAATLDSGIPPLLTAALEALARVGARRAVPKVLPLLGVRDEAVRRAAVAALVSAGDDVLSLVKARMPEASPEEKRSLDAV